MEALLVQLEHELQRFDVSESNPIETVFIGGGTPSTVDPGLYKPIFSRIIPLLKEGAEVTSEANPNSATYEWLEGMFRLGVNRLSFGIQSFDEEKLKRLGRAHNTLHARNAITYASQIGFPHLSVDLIYGVHGDTQELLQRDLDQALSFPIDHISLYALTIEEHTPFETMPRMAHEELDLTKWLFETIGSYGFDHYEISNFGAYRSEHNLGYWRYKPYIGLGAGAVGFDHNTRLYPPTDIEYYIDHPLEIHQEILTPKEIVNEKLFLGFRSIVGVESSLLNEKQNQTAKMLVTEGVLEIREGRYFNPNFLLADEIALRVEGY